MIPLWKLEPENVNAIIYEKWQNLSQCLGGSDPRYRFIVSIIGRHIVVLELLLLVQTIQALCSKRCTYPNPCFRGLAGSFPWDGLKAAYSGVLQEMLSRINKLFVSHLFVSTVDLSQLTNVAQRWTDGRTDKCRMDIGFI